VSSQNEFLVVPHVDTTGPSNSPDLNPCDYFLWGYLKEKIFPKKPQTIMELRALIIQACSEVTEDMCHQVINIITVHVEEVARRNGGHIEHLIHRGYISIQWFFVFYSSFC
jgi:phenylpyruvate tautomerase PptA (4-oxalocrotonate tautomerase family)